MLTNKKVPLLASVLAIAALLGGCASGVKLDKKGGAPVETRDTTSSTTTTTPPAQSGVTTLDKTQGESLSPASMDRVIYFDFDSYAVKDEYRPIIEAHAKMLKADPSRKEVAEGHTDERGGSEYNLALGQKRAEAVVSQMKLLGVGDSQLEAVSYGKERPAVDGHDEAAWAKNRRVELRSK
ncbi:MAG TPA: peptidoglycan-associated lipoprotein Pal [Burkholderiaceae bacterium]